MSSKEKTKESPRGLLFFVLHRLYVQPDGSFISRPWGIYPAETLDQALAHATLSANTRGCTLFRLVQVISSETPP